MSAKRTGPGRPNHPITLNCFKDKIWKVITDPGTGRLLKGSYVRTRYLDGNRFQLEDRVGKDGPWIPVQPMAYNDTTKQLENEAGDRERCIVFWPRKDRNGAVHNSIFGMRIMRIGANGKSPDPWTDLARFEQRQENGGWTEAGDGSWGAEEGGG